MKAFDKWYDKYSYQAEIDWGGDGEEGLPKTICKDSWKAALEWAKSRSLYRLISVNEIEEELNERA